jgi:ATP-dependent 26S proteasome regulatory subunit
MSYSLLNKKKNLAPLRNIMLYGPPGTGKVNNNRKINGQYII